MPPPNFFREVSGRSSSVNSSKPLLADSESGTSRLASDQSGGRGEGAALPLLADSSSVISRLGIDELSEGGEGKGAPRLVSRITGVSNGQSEGSGNTATPLL